MSRAAVIALVFLLSACGGSGDDGSVTRTVESAGPVGAGPSAAPSPSPSPSPETDADAAAEEYMAAFATGNATKMRAMADLAEPGSAAHAYAIHQQAVAATQQAAGVPDEPQTMTTRDGGFEVCNMGEESVCGIYDGFQALPNGKLTSFMVDGKPIDSRLLPSGERAPVRLGAVEVRVVSAYKTIQSESLFVTLEVRNGGTVGVSVAPFEATYVSAQGQQSKTNDVFGVTEVQPGATGPLAVVFPDADPGGTLVLEVTTEDYDELGTLRLPVA